MNKYQILNEQHTPQIPYVPKGITDKGMITYLLAMIACLVAYSSHMMPVKWWIFGLVSVLGFFYYANTLTKSWLNIRPITFAKKVFWTGFALRIVWVLISYWLYYEWTGKPFAIDAADEIGYHDIGEYGASLFREGQWNIFEDLRIYGGLAFSDMGYPTRSDIH